MDIQELFNTAFRNVRATWQKPKRKPKAPFIKQAMPFIRNEPGFRYELDEETQQPKRVSRKHGQVVL